MAFKRKLPDTPNIKPHFWDGAGEVELYPILNGPEEMYQKGRVCSIIRLKPGCEIGKHQHVDDAEVFYILSGHGKYYLDGEYVDVEPGDVLFCDDGDWHGMINESEEDLKLFAVVLYTK